jgi:voltage-gated sodium channel
MEKFHSVSVEVLLWQVFQMFIAIALFSNFALNIVETEIQPDKDDELYKRFELVDLAFTAFYLMELAINLFVNWLTPFLKNGWSIFDAVCVISGLVGELLQALGNGEMNLTLIRTLRIFKIIRLFSRLKSLQTIVIAITSTIIPLFNTFLIYGVVLSIYSVLGTQLFGRLYPEKFGLFSSACLTMFQISTGDGWLTDVLRPLMKRQEAEELYLENAGSVLFFISFILFVMIVLVNVAVAVLLEGFLSSISQYVQEERQAEGMSEYSKSAGDLDALLSTLSNYDSEENLESMIHQTYEYLDVDASDSINFEEFRDGLEKLDIEPRLYITWETFESFTRNQTLCDQDGCLTSSSFALCMRIQLRGYAQRIVAHQMNESLKYAPPPIPPLKRVWFWKYQFAQRLIRKGRAFSLLSLRVELLPSYRHW